MKCNPYCNALGIGIPQLEVAKDHRDANYYGLLIVVLLERGEPVTLQQAAARFEEAGVAPAAQALASLKRCKPARPPIYRDGDWYALDPYDEQADLWAFRLGLLPPKAASLPADRPAEGPLPTVDAPLRTTHLDEAWRNGLSGNWSAQRVALCVLDAHGGAMKPQDVISFVSARSRWSPVSARSAAYWRRGSAIRVRADGRWELDPDHQALRSARRAVIDRIETRRKSAIRHGDPAVIAAYDIIAAIDVRTLLRTLRFDPETRRLGELGPPQRTRTIDGPRRTLKITTGLLVQGSCGIGRPFGDETKMGEYLAAGELTKLRRRLEADARSLYAIYQYGRLHGTVRLRWGFLDERLPAPWVHRDEVTLHNLKNEAHRRGVPLEIVVGSAPGWADPWSRLRPAHVVTEPDGWRSWLVDDTGSVIPEDEIQLARLAGRR